MAFPSTSNVVFDIFLDNPTVTYARISYIHSCDTSFFVPQRGGFFRQAMYTASRQLLTTSALRHQNTETDRLEAQKHATRNLVIQCVNTPPQRYVVQCYNAQQDWRTSAATSRRRQLTKAAANKHSHRLCTNFSEKTTIKLCTQQTTSAANKEQTSQKHFQRTRLYDPILVAKPRHPTQHSIGPASEETRRTTQVQRSIKRSMTLHKTHDSLTQDVSLTIATVVNAID